MVLLKKQRVNVIYIAGPITGYPDNNFPAFNKAELDLFNGGWDVENPAKHGIVEGATWEDYMLSCLAQISKCGNMYMLKGWEDSRGACIEYSLAELLGLTIIFQAD